MMSLPVMDSTPPKTAPPPDSTPPGSTALPYGQQAGGAHPTGNAFLF